MRHLLAAVLALGLGTTAAQERAIPLSALRSGITFAGSDVRALQADDDCESGDALGAARRRTVDRTGARRELRIVPS